LQSNQWTHSLDDDASDDDVNSSFAQLFEREDDAVVVTESEAPFRIKYVNKAWEKTCGYSFEEVVGETLALIQGPMTDRNELRRLSEEVKMKKEFQTILINYKKSGESFRNCLSIAPIHLNDYGILCLVGYVRVV
jgi:PAS domain S-box-containing protein